MTGVAAPHRHGLPGPGSAADAGGSRGRGRWVVVVVVVVVAAGVVSAWQAGAFSPTSSRSGGGGSVASAAVVRTTLTTTVQEGGSIGYDGSYTITAPSPGSASAVSTDQQAVASDQQALSGDEQARSDAVASDDQAIAADQANVSSGQSILSTDQARETADCAVTSSAATGPDTAACTADETQVRTDQATLTTARQKLAADQQTGRATADGDQAKIASDQVKLSGDQAALGSLEHTAASRGTTYTWLPQPGQVIRQDQRVYAVSGEPVPLLYGAVAAYRPFYAGMPDGADAGELTHDLIALGFGAGLAQSDHYSAATAAAVARWQRALGLPATGKILLGQVVFEPGPIRVTMVTPSVGAAVTSSGAVLTATGTTPVVTVDLDVTQEYLVKPGDAVSVVLPDGTTTVGGRVESVGAVATCPGGSNTGTATSAGQSPCSSSGSNGGSGSNTTPQVTVTITLDSTPQGPALDQAPVNVNITEYRAAGVLAVPVNALVAVASGGYGVDVVTGGTSHLVGVTTGLYSSTLVQISGPGITDGTRVEVPSS